MDTKKNQNIRSKIAKKIQIKEESGISEEIDVIFKI